MKVRGFRIGLSEIEARLHERAGAHEATMMVQEGTSGGCPMDHLIPDETQCSSTDLPVGLVVEQGA